MKMRHTSLCLHNIGEEMNTSSTTTLAGGFTAKGVQQLAQGAKDKGLLLGSTTYLIGSTEGFIGNRLPVAT